MAVTIPPTDAELDAWIRARLALIGIDLGQLPVADPAAPADQTPAIVAAAEAFLATLNDEQREAARHDEADDHPHDAHGRRCTPRGTFGCRPHHAGPRQRTPEPA